MEDPWSTFYGFVRRRGPQLRLQFSEAKYTTHKYTVYILILTRHVGLATWRHANDDADDDDEDGDGANNSSGSLYLCLCKVSAEISRIFIRNQHK